MKRRVLLVLDGVEPLQHGPGAQLGQLKDLGLRALLRRFAAMRPGAAHGLVVLTSRLAVKDIARWQDGAAPWATPWPSWRPDARFEVVADPTPYTPPKSCSFIDVTLTIRADGTVVACCYDLLSKSDLGNVMQQDLSEIWNGAHAEFNGRFANGDFPSPCNTCTQVTERRYLVIKNPTSLTFPV